MVAQVIVNELETSVNQLNVENIDTIIDKIKSYKRIFVYGAGRSGLMLKAFAMRLMQIESETARKSALMKMLQLKYVRLDKCELEWREAMRITAEDLILDGYFDTSYVEKAIENVEEYGSYIIVNKGIALAHANKEAGVYEDGLSLLVARNGIHFEDGETVYLMFFFSQKGEADYLDLFKKIIRLGNDQGNIEKMRKMDKPGEVYQLIVEILTEY